LIALLVALAHAADPYQPEIVVLPLEGAPGTSATDLRSSGDGIQRALSGQGFRPTSPSDLAKALVEPKRAEILALVAEGRRLLSEGDPDLATPFLQDAAKRSDLRSDVRLRTDEVAEAWFTLGEALVVGGDEAKARQAFARAVALSPDYLTTLGLDERSRAVAASAATEPPPPLDDAEAARILSKVGADYLLSGTLFADGSLKLWLRRGASVRAVVERPGPFVPREADDPWFDLVAQDLAVAAMIRRPPDPVKPIDVPPVKPLAKTTDPVVPKGHSRWTAGTITATVLLVAAAAGTTVLLWPEPPTPDPTWTVTVRPP
jgi:hypothetical protein